MMAFAAESWFWCRLQFLKECLSNQALVLEVHVKAVIVIQLQLYVPSELSVADEGTIVRSAH